MHSGNTDAAEMLRAMRAFLKENDMMAYLTMMSVRLIEFHRPLKNTGSLYLHCDPTASHYLKPLLDAILDSWKTATKLSGNVQTRKAWLQAIPDLHRHNSWLPKDERVTFHPTFEADDAFDVAKL